MDKLLSILEDARPDVDFENEKGLIDNGILDSFDIISIVGDINDEFDVEIAASHLVPENFNSVEAIMKLIESLQ